MVGKYGYRFLTTRRITSVSKKNKVILHKKYSPEEEMKKIIASVALVAAISYTNVSFAQSDNDIIESNIVYVTFDTAKIGSLSCVEQIKKDGTVVFDGVITKAEYDEKYSGFWFKDNSRCAYWKKS